MIVAGPGTGKTHTLIRRIARISKGGSRTAPTLEGSPSSDSGPLRLPRGKADSEAGGFDEQILAVTFTNKAAEEMQERLNQCLPDAKEKVFVGTFHCFCLALLRKHIAKTDLPKEFSIATESDLIRTARQLWPGSTKRECQERLEAVARWKTQCFAQETPEDVLAYNRILRADHLLDYEDLLLEALRLLAGAPERQYSFVFVDEYQDINALQHALLKEFVRKGVLLTAIGDPNQAIYGFRGADPSYFRNFTQDFPGAGILSLSDNYRSAPNLLKASDQIMAKAESFFVPQLTAKIYTQGRLTVYEAPTDKAEAEYVVHKIEQMAGGTSLFSHDSGRVDTAQPGERTFRDIAVLYRLNAQRRLLEEALARHGLPFLVSGGTSLIERPPIADMIIFLQLIVGQEVCMDAAVHLIQLLADGIGVQTTNKIAASWQEGRHRVGLKDLERLCWQGRCLSAQPPEALRQLVKDAQSLRDKAKEAAFLVSAMMDTALWQALLGAHPSWQENIQRFVLFSKRRSDPREFFDYLLLQRPEDEADPRAEKIHLLTLHASKGLEFPVVFITGCEENLLPLSLDKRTSDPQEERRLFYVGMTRAKEALFLTHARRRYLWGRSLSSPPSPYLEDIEHQLKEYAQAPPRRPQKQKSPFTQMELFGSAP